MLRTFSQTRDTRFAIRLASIALFTLLTIVGAKVRVEIGAVPFTLQTLVVVLSGLVLGARDGALSQLAYLALLATGLPVDTRGLGLAVFAGPTWGYLLSWVPTAYLVGWIAERSREKLGWRLAASLIGMAFTLACGAIVLKFNLALTWDFAIADGFMKFVPEAIAKAVIASVLAEGGRSVLMRHWSQQ